MNDWVTIATFTYPHQAALLSSKLESEGIECYLKDGNMISANPFYSNAIGGVKIQVRGNDVERGNKIVEEFYKHLNSEEEDAELVQEDKPDEIEEQVKDGVKCPNCGSFEVHQDKTPSSFKIISVILLGIPLIFPGRKKYHCFNCGANFVPEKVK